MVCLLYTSVLSVLFYGVVSGTLTEATTRKLESFELWLYRRILIISWTAHVTNVEVLGKMKKDTEVINTVDVYKRQVCVCVCV